MTAIPPRPQEAENPRPNLLKYGLLAISLSMSFTIVPFCLNDFQSVSEKIKSNLPL